MAVPNTAQIYGITGNIQWTATALTLANTNMAGVTGTTTPVYSCANTGGDMLQYLQFRPLSTNAANVARVFINNGSPSNVEANNVPFMEVTLPACTAATTGSAEGVALTVNLVMTTGQNVFLTLAGDASGSGWRCCGVGMRY